LLLVTYRYNVNTGVQRKGHHDFGMPYLDIIDQIQIKMVQIFGCDPFAHHVNQMSMKPVDDFVAVGIGPPLNYDPKYVEHGDPDPRLTGGMLFLATRK
jgi:hypothetical protein